MYSLNTIRKNDGVHLSDPDSKETVYVIKYQDSTKEYMWALHRNCDCMIVAQFNSIEAAEYRALSDFIERKADPEKYAL